MKAQTKFWSNLPDAASCTKIATTNSIQMRHRLDMCKFSLMHHNAIEHVVVQNLYQLEGLMPKNNSFSELWFDFASEQNWQHPI